MVSVCDEGRTYVRVSIGLSERKTPLLALSICMEKEGMELVYNTRVTNNQRQIESKAPHTEADALR